MSILSSMFNVSVKPVVPYMVKTSKSVMDWAETCFVCLCITCCDALGVMFSLSLSTLDLYVKVEIQVGFLCCQSILQFT